MKRAILIGFGALLSVGLSMEAYADKVCRGKVLDEQGEPLTGAVIRIPGAKGGVTTDIEGNFKITVPDNTRRIDISFLGYKPLQ